MKVITRFAPSPTGNLHIGGARTAIYNYLFARHHDGKFILRIEDTDLERSKPEYTDNILKALNWLGLEYDEIYYQSKRLDIYKEYAGKLLKEGRAYKRVDPDKGEGIVFKIDRDYIYWDDAVHERIGRDISTDPDLVIVKSNGYPTYNFACVVDDILMNITHVIRGNDHIPNTSKQISLFRALGAEPPVFAHIPLILNPDLSKMSKDYKKTGKEGDPDASIVNTSTLDYKDQGYLPEALINFLSLLGWSPGNDLEIMDKATLIKLFTLERVNKKSAVFDVPKLLWLNGHYIRNKQLDEVVALCSDILGKHYDLSTVNNSVIRELVRQNHERLKTLSDIVEQTRFYFEKEIRYNEKAVAKFIRKDKSKDILKDILDRFNRIKNFDKESIAECLKKLAEKHEVKFLKVAQPLRVAITGDTISPPIDETAAVLGKEIVMRRLEEVLKL